MPTERLPTLGHDGNAYVVVRKTPGFTELCGDAHQCRSISSADLLSITVRVER